MFPVGNNRIDSLAGRQRSRLHLRLHTAGAPTGSGSPGQFCHAFIDRINPADQLCVRIKPRIMIKETVNIGKDNKFRSLAQHCHHGGKHVIIAEEALLRFNLRIAYRIILINNRDNSHLQQRIKRVYEIILLLLLLDILRIQKNLCSGLVKFRKEMVVQCHHTALSDGCTGLLHSHIPRFFRQPQLIGSDCDGSGGYKDNFISPVLHIGKYLRQFFKLPDIILPDVIGQC